MIVNTTSEIFQTNVSLTEEGGEPLTKKPIAEVSRVKLVPLGTDPKYIIALVLIIQPQSKAKFDVLKDNYMILTAKQIN